MKKASRRKVAILPPPEMKLRPRANLQKIYDHSHELLSQLIEAGSQRTKKYRPQAEIESKAKGWGINSAQLRKRLLFADMYNQKDLNRLLKLESLTWAHVQKLLTVKDPHQRHEFAKVANKNRWSAHSLACEIEGWRRTQPEASQASSSKRSKNYRMGLRQGGRPVKPRPLTPGTLQELLQELVRMRRFLAAFNNPGSDRVAPPTHEDIPHCKQMIDDVVDEFQKLKKQSGKFIAQIKQVVKET